jgi:hypothetical protein
MKNYEYWYCEIGPIEKNKIPYGGDYPLRTVVKEEFEKMFKDEVYSCSSGWGLSRRNKEIFSRIRSLSVLDPSGKIIKEIEDILEKFYKKYDKDI